MIKLFFSILGILLLGISYAGNRADLQNEVDNTLVEIQRSVYDGNLKEAFNYTKLLEKILRDRDESYGNCFELPNCKRRLGTGAAFTKMNCKRDMGGKSWNQVRPRVGPCENL